MEGIFWGNYPQWMLEKIDGLGKTEIREDGVI